MTEARYCDRCSGLFAGPPAARVTTPGGEFDLCNDCGDELETWWELLDTDLDEAEFPTATVEKE